MYSFSQIQTYQTCPLKFRYRYIDGIRVQDQVESIDQMLGKIVHSTLEKLYNDINNFTRPTLESVLDVYKKSWDESLAKVSDIASINKGKDTAEDYIRRGEEYLKNYFQKNQPFDREKVIATEQQIIFELDIDGAKIKFQGYIDRIDKDGETFVINDYKTNKHLPTEDKQEYIEQLTLYAQGIKQKYGKYHEKIKARLHFLHFDIVDEREIDDASLQEILMKYSDIIREIEKNKIIFEGNLRTESDKTIFKPCENNYCKYCEYMEICPLFAHRNMLDEEMPELGAETVKRIIDDYVSTVQKLSELEKKKDVLKDALSDYVRKSGIDINRLYGENYKISISKGFSYSIKDKQALYEKCQSDGILDEVIDIDRNKVVKKIKDGELKIEDLKGIVEEKDSWTFRGS